jgi:hypothetical protein
MPSALAAKTDRRHGPVSLSGRTESMSSGVHRGIKREWFDLHSFDEPVHCIHIAHREAVSKYLRPTLHVRVISPIVGDVLRV